MVTQTMEKGCKICKKYKEHYFQDRIKGTGMEFYKLMHGDFLQHLRLPKKFTYCCRELPEIVDVKGPGGKIRSIGLKETNDGMWLQSGWKEFVEAHHIQENYLLVFKYDAKSCFEISIFDENRCNKVASFLSMESNSKGRERSENSLENLKLKSRRKVVVCSPSGIYYDDMPHASPFSASHKISGDIEKPAPKYQWTKSSCKRRIYKSNELSSDPKNKQCNHYVGAQGRSFNKQESVDIRTLEKFTHPNLYISGNRHLTFEEEKQALQLVHSVQPTNPCFISFLPPGSVYNCCYMYAPAGFRKAHLPSENCTIFLQVQGQSKRWGVDVVVEQNFARFYWKSFVLDNNLQVGDACLFELVNDLTDVVIIVSILRSTGQDGL